MSTEDYNRKKEELSKRKRERDKNDLRKILSIVEGRRFIWRLLSEAGCFRNSFTGTSHTYFNEGRRDIGLLFLNEIMETRPESFTQMQREYKNDQLTEKMNLEGINDNRNDWE